MTNLLDFARVDHSRLEPADAAEWIRAGLGLSGNELLLDNAQASAEFADGRGDGAEFRLFFR